MAVYAAAVVAIKEEEEKSNVDFSITAVLIYARIARFVCQNGDCKSKKREKEEAEKYVIRIGAQLNDIISWQ